MQRRPASVLFLPPVVSSPFLFFNDTATTEIYTLSLHDALPILARPRRNGERRRAPTASISKESPAITGVVEMVIRRPMTSKEAKMGKVMRHTLGASLNIRHNLSSSKGPKPLQLKLLTTYIPKTSAFTLAFSTSQRLRTTRASARTFFTFRHYITPSARNF